MLDRVGHALACGGSVVTRRMAIGGEEVGEGGGEGRWLGKPERKQI